MGLVAYNPNDPEQNAFLASLARGETGGGTGSQWVGYGGIDLSNAPTGPYGFPQWSGDRTKAGPTHAAGYYQFQPGTWEDVASRYNLDFRNPADQHAGAWYLAQETYQARAGRSLDADLDAGQYSYIEGALVDVWPSVTGNGANPFGLVAGMGDDWTSGDAPWPQSIIRGAGEAADSIGSFFTRGGLIIVGAVIVFVALWFLLADNGTVPSPQKVAGSAVRAITG